MSAEDSIAEEPTPLVDAVRLSKSYRLFDRPQHRFLQLLARDKRQYFREFWALKNVSLKIGKGEAVGIIGRNGAGKSTLLQIIAGTLAPTEGSITVKGRVAALLQLGSGFNPEFSGRENVYLNGSILGFTRAEIDRRYDEIVSFADIGNFLEQPIKTYSSGMTMRLAFAVSTCLEPDLLIVDEALSVGDAVFGFKCRNRLADLIAHGTSVLFVSHDIGAVKSFCSRAIYLERGSIKEEGLPEDVAETYFHDTRVDQLKGQGGMVGARREWKIGPPSRELEVTSASIVEYRFSGGGHECHLQHGDKVSFEVLIAAKNARDLALSVQVQSQNMLSIGGKWTSLAPYSNGDDKLIVVQGSFLAALNTGRYYLTLRLESRVSADDFFPIHKIPGALTINVHAHESLNLLGSADLGCCFELGMADAG